MNKNFNLDTLKNDVEDWIHNWVSIYHPELEAVPCPFAKQAAIDEKILYCYCDDEDTVIACLKNLSSIGFDVDKEVLVIGTDPTRVSADSLQKLTNDANHSYLNYANLVALEDHPDSKEIVNGVAMNHGKWALLLVQNKNKLNKASDILKKQGYYRTWSQENIDDVVSWRKNI